MRIYGFHGVYPVENQVGRYFEIDAELYLPLDYAAANDDLNQSVNYAEVFDFIKQEFTRETYKLIETTAIRLADALLSRFPLEKAVIRVRKPNPPVDGHLDYAEVQVERSRQ
jgi:dihydroneopterin aldolase